MFKAPFVVLNCNPTLLRKKSAFVSTLWRRTGHYRLFIGKMWYHCGLLWISVSQIMWA